MDIKNKKEKIIEYLKNILNNLDIKKNKSEIYIYPNNIKCISSICKFYYINNYNFYIDSGLQVVHSYDSSDNSDVLLYINLNKFDKIIKIDKNNGLIKVQCGAKIKTVENLLREEGLTLGFLPFWIENLTVSAWIALGAPKNCNQPNDGSSVLSFNSIYGPGYLYNSTRVPRSAAGPDIKTVLQSNSMDKCIIFEADLNIYSFWEKPIHFKSMFSGLNSAINVMKQIACSRVFPSDLFVNFQKSNKKYLTLLNIDFSLYPYPLRESRINVCKKIVSVQNGKLSKTNSDFKPFGNKLNLKNGNIYFEFALTWDQAEFFIEECLTSKEVMQLLLSRATTKSLSIGVVVKCKKNEIESFLLKHRSVIKNVIYFSTNKPIFFKSMHIDKKLEKKEKLLWNSIK